MTTEHDITTSNKVNRLHNDIPGFANNFDEADVLHQLRSRCTNKE